MDLEIKDCPIVLDRDVRVEVTDIGRLIEISTTSSPDSVFQASPKKVYSYYQNPPRGTCPDCNVKYDNLTKHALEVHKKYICEVCGMLFLFPSMLASHLEIKHEEMDLRCSTCYKLFKSRQNLHRHVKSAHHRVKENVCLICNKAFSQKIHLKYHVMIHTGEKQHVCNICQKAFRLKGDLNKHTTVHSDVRAYVCKQCGKRFAGKENLFKHSQTHQSVTTFQHRCHFCSKNFLRKTNMRRHVLIVHGKGLPDDRMQLESIDEVKNVVEGVIKSMEDDERLICGAEDKQHEVVDNVTVETSEEILEDHNLDLLAKVALVTSASAKVTYLDYDKDLVLGSGPYDAIIVLEEGKGTAVFEQDDVIVSNEIELS